MQKLAFLCVLFMSLCALGQTAPSAPGVTSAKKPAIKQHAFTPAAPGANLTWNAPSSGCSGAESCTYNIYRGPTSGSEVLLISGIAPLSYQDLAVTRGSSYCWEVAAVNLQSMVSPMSNEVCAQIPTAPTAPGNLTVVTQ